MPRVYGTSSTPQVAVFYCQTPFCAGADGVEAKHIGPFDDDPGWYEPEACPYCHHDRLSEDPAPDYAGVAADIEYVLDDYEVGEKLSYLELNTRIERFIREIYAINELA